MRGLVAGEAQLTAQLEGLQRGGAAHGSTGLLVAQVAAKQDTILRFIPTPVNEGAKHSSVDADWMVEHAVQVSRMLPGGVAVVGCYAFAAGAKFSSLEAKLQPVLGALAKRMPTSSGERQASLLIAVARARGAPYN